MTARGKKAKFTTAQIKEHIRTIQKIVGKLKADCTSEHFTAITPEQIERKLKRVNSPIIAAQEWNDAKPGGKFTYSLSIFNPDPTEAGSLFVHVWIGSGNVDPVVGTFLSNVDTRFPRLLEPKFSGLSLSAGGTATLNFTIKSPPTIEKTNYIGNSCLMQFDMQDMGKYLDRSVFVFGIS